MAGFVLTDAGPLIGLARVDGLAWLHALFGRVWMPQEVRREVLPGLAFAAEQSILAAESAGWLAVHSPTPRKPSLPDLDEGEAACIRIGLTRKEPVLLLMDERAGRALAVEHGCAWPAPPR